MNIATNEITNILTKLSKEIGTPEGLQGIFIKINPTNLEFMATDGNRIALKRIEAEFNANAIGNKYKLTLKQIETIKEFKKANINLLDFEYNEETKALNINSIVLEPLEPAYIIKYEQIIANYLEETLAETGYTEQEEVKRIAVNRKFLIDLLQTLEKTRNDVVTLEFTSAISPVYIKPHGTDTKEKEMALLMPVVIR